MVKCLCVTRVTSAVIYNLRAHVSFEEGVGGLSDFWSARNDFPRILVGRIFLPLLSAL